MVFYVQIYPTLSLVLFMSSCFSSPLPASNMNNARVLLTYLRGGDYAHAGDKEAVNMVIQKTLELSTKVQNGPCLDIGSGFGGTANQFYHLGFHSIYGIDIDEMAVNYAKEHYPDIQFFTANATLISNIFEPDFFSFIYMFNVFYAIEDKATLLENLFKIAKPGAILALFDYTTEQTSFSLKDLADKPMYPLVLRDLKKNLKETGWEIIEIINLSSQFLTWYEALLNKMEKEQLTLSNHFSKEDIKKVKATFNTIHQWLSSSLLGGAVVYARKSETIAN